MSITLFSAIATIWISSFDCSIFAEFQVVVSPGSTGAKLTTHCLFRWFLWRQVTTVRFRDSDKHHYVPDKRSLSNSVKQPITADGEIICYTSWKQKFIFSLRFKQWNFSFSKRRAFLIRRWLARHPLRYARLLGFFAAELQLLANLSIFSSLYLS